MTLIVKFIQEFRYEFLDLMTARGRLNDPASGLDDQRLNPVHVSKYENAILGAFRSWSNGH